MAFRPYVTPATEDPVCERARQRLQEVGRLAVDRGAAAERVRELADAEASASGA